MQYLSFRKESRVCFRPCGNTRDESAQNQNMTLVTASPVVIQTNPADATATSKNLGAGLLILLIVAFVSSFLAPIVSFIAFIVAFHHLQLQLLRGRRVQTRFICQSSLMLIAQIIYWGDIVAAVTFSDSSSIRAEVTITNGKYTLMCTFSVLGVLLADTVSFKPCLQRCGNYFLCRIYLQILVTSTSILCLNMKIWTSIGRC
jgi:hypothetical protein